MNKGVVKKENIFYTSLPLSLITIHTNTLDFYFYFDWKKPTILGKETKLKEKRINGEVEEFKSLEGMSLSLFFF